MFHVYVIIKQYSFITYVCFSVVASKLMLHAFRCQRRQLFECNIETLFLLMHTMAFPPEGNVFVNRDQCQTIVPVS